MVKRKKNKNKWRSLKCLGTALVVIICDGVAFAKPWKLFVTYLCEPVLLDCINISFTGPQRTIKFHSSCIWHETWLFVCQSLCLALSAGILPPHRFVEWHFSVSSASVFPSVFISEDTTGQDMNPLHFISVCSWWKRIWALLEILFVFMTFLCPCLPLCLVKEVLHVS